MRLSKTHGMDQAAPLRGGRRAAAKHGRIEIMYAPRTYVTPNVGGLSHYDHFDGR